MGKEVLTNHSEARVDDVELLKGAEVELTAEQKDRLEAAGCEFASNKKEKEEAAKTAPPNNEGGGS